MVAAVLASSQVFAVFSLVRFVLEKVIVSGTVYFSLTWEISIHLHKRIFLSTVVP